MVAPAGRETRGETRCAEYLGRKLDIENEMRMRLSCHLLSSNIIVITHNKPALLYAVWYEKVLRLHRKVKAACVAAHRAYA